MQQGETEADTEYRPAVDSEAASVRVTEPRAELGQSSRAALEWPGLLRLLASFCGNELAARRLRGWLPAPTPDQARARMALSGEAMSLASAGTPLPSNDVTDLSPTLLTIERAGLPGSPELFRLGRCLAAALGLRRFLGQHAESAPGLRHTLVVAPVLGPLQETFARCFTDTGELSDAASAGLRRARRERERERERLRGILQRVLKENTQILQGSYFAERDGRYVLPIRSDAEYRLDGLVLGASSSGQTLYVAPRETLEPANALAEAEARVLREEAAVLHDLSEQVRPLASEVRAAFEACIRSNELAAVADFARRFQALALPLVERPRVMLLAARHPLLVQQAAEAVNHSLAPGRDEGAGPKAVVANDIAIESGQALMISGPNAGGKTVSLKCLGLAVLMAQSGIPVLASEGSEIGFFQDVLVEIGDHQSLEHSLSSFTAHLERIKSFLELGREGSLILVDELASGTDPLEGAALARALLEDFTERGAAVVVTTHYELLRELGTEGRRYVNASVGFDLDSLKPTFELRLGVPGVSSALAVAMQRGIPPEIVARAHSLVPEPVRRQQELLAELERERAALTAARERVVASEREQRMILAELERKRARFENEERERLAKQARELTREVEEARHKLRQARVSLQEQPDKLGLRAVEKQIQEAAQPIAIGGRLIKVLKNKPGTQQAPEPSPRSPQAHELGPGDRAHYPELGVEVEVLSAPVRDRVRVAAGPLRLTLPLSALRVKASSVSATQARSKVARPPAAARGQPEPSEQSMASPIRTGETTCDLRGLSVEEGLQRVEQCIDKLLRQGEIGGFVLHGHGTGVLKRAVREHLKSHSHVSRSAAAERDDGGDALTVFWLKG